ncbi:MAG: cytochrome bc complex cytochrome b subunit [Deltaproteobacteria bacterium]|jgi:quinol-cytochrome oxidoreductase complex cytochrome b subunit|nr:cytochrome bc complex cytochrome b subunit [Deltaproteobacteria bacterium]
MDKQDRHALLKAFPVDIKGLYEKADEPLPHSAKRWWWCWGGIVGLQFAFLAITGLLLAMYYRADPGTAYDSVAFITEHARYGQFIRSVHGWSASFMVIFVFLHMLRAFVTGSFREYRWGAWMGGVLLLTVTFGFGFTGYALIFDQRSYWGMIITSNLIATIPLIGNLLRNLFLAGPEINTATLSRIYALHVQILPALLIMFVVVHLFFVRLMGMYLPGNQKDREEEKVLTDREGVYHFYPDHLASEFAVFLYLVLVICLLALALPATMGTPSDPLYTPEHIKPEWYFLPYYYLLKIVPGIVGIALMAISAVALFFWPILDHYLFQKIDKLFKGRIEVSLILGLTVVIVYLVWAFAET